MLVVTDLRCWFHKFLKFVVPECGSGYRRKNPRVVEIRPLGCRESAGSNLARSTEPLLSLPNQAGSANRHVDQIHLYLFTADCVPVQRDATVPVITPSRAGRSDPIFILWLFELEAGPLENRSILIVIWLPRGGS